MTKKDFARIIEDLKEKNIMPSSCTKCGGTVKGDKALYWSDEAVSKNMKVHGVCGVCAEGLLREL